MPTMASIVVKKADETTNITYDALTPSSGDGKDAWWRQDTGGSAAVPVGLRPFLKLRSVNNGPGTARRLIGVYRYPYIAEDASSVYTKYADVEITITATMPTSVPGTVLSEGARQGLNLFASTLFKQAVEQGIAP